MPDDAAAVRFTVLDPHRARVDSTRPARGLYAYPDDLRACWVRGNMIASLDGGATADGKSGSLGGSGDRAIFHAAAPTRRRHPGRCGHRPHRELLRRAVLAPPSARTARRRGQAEVPPIAVVTNRGRLDHDARIFTRTEVPPLILTSRQRGRRRDRAGSDRWPRSSTPPGRDPDRVDAATALAILAERGLLPRARRGRAAAPRLADRARSARRAVPDDRAATGRRRGPAHRDRTRPAAHPHAAQPPAHRRRRLSVHALRQSRRNSAHQYCGRHASASPGPCPEHIDWSL